MTEDSLVYTNLLMYSPVASPDGVIRMEEAVIPIECHYERSVCLFFFFFFKVCLYSSVGKTSLFKNPCFVPQEVQFV